MPQLMEEEVVEMVEKTLITVAFGKICAQGPGKLRFLDWIDALKLVEAVEGFGCRYAQTRRSCGSDKFQNEALHIKRLFGIPGPDFLL